MNIFLAKAALFSTTLSADAYAPLPMSLSFATRHKRPAFSQQIFELPPACTLHLTTLRMSDNEVIDAEPDDDATNEEKKEAVGNLVADDEWNGLGMELSELIRLAIVEDAKQNARDFLGKDGYKMGDFSKEIDLRVKREVAQLRDKDEYELGDLSAALDKIAKDLTCEMTGKEDYEFGDLSVEIDTQVKSAVASFCGKEEYEFGDLSREIDKRTKVAVADFTGKGDYKFGDISKEVMKRRSEWVVKNYGEDALSNYRFGDLTKSAVSSLTGKDEYEFGDISKKIFGGFFKK